MNKVIVLPLSLCLVACGHQTPPEATMPVPEFAIRISLETIIVMS